MADDSVGEKARKRTWIWWALSSVFLVCMPSLIMTIIETVWFLTGHSLWYQIDKEPAVTDVIFLPVLMAVGNWPLFTLLPLMIRWMLRHSASELRQLRWALAGSILVLAIVNLPFWLGTPAEFSSKATDAGQGTGVLIAVLIVLSPIAGTIGWYAGVGVAILLDKLRGVEVRRED